MDKAVRAKIETLESRLAIAVEALRKVYKTCDEPWGELYGSVWSIPDDDYEAWNLRDLIGEALAKIEHKQASDNA